MPFWKEKPVALSSLDRIAVSLEQLAVLYELDLISRGIVTRTGTEEGEVVETDPLELERLEHEEELKRKYGLPPGTKLGAGGKDGRGWRPEDAGSSGDDDQLPGFWFPSGLAFPTGPEGAETAEQGPEGERGERNGAAGIPT